MNAVSIVNTTLRDVSCHPGLMARFGFFDSSVDTMEDRQLILLPSFPTSSLRFVRGSVRHLGGELLVNIGGLCCPGTGSRSLEGIA